MGKFKRFCMIVFVVAAVLGIGVLAALWFAWEPLFPAIAWLMSMPWFFVVEAVLLGITALGLLVVLIRAITAPGKNSQLELERDNGSIAITQNAIQSTVKHVVESHHGLSTDNVKVHITNKHDPRMSIHAKIDPGRNAELGQLGAKLQDEIAATLESHRLPRRLRAHRSQATPTWLHPRSRSRPQYTDDTPSAPDQTGARPWSVGDATMTQSTMRIHPPTPARSRRPSSRRRQASQKRRTHASSNRSVSKGSAAPVPIRRAGECSGRDEARQACTPA
ncbi:MAG: alkaline shock response membrane anchor protein AmaP [Eggerthellaceae bacterium]